MLRWAMDVIAGLALLGVGFLMGGTVAWYKGWDQGFREGYDAEMKKEHQEQAETREDAHVDFVKGNRHTASRRHPIPIRKLL